MHRREFLRLSSTLVLASGYDRIAAAPELKKNFVLILADDLGYECLGGNGGTTYQTPQLDNLAANSIRFDHCYSTPLCTPSRCQLMTGQYNFRNYTEFGSLKPGAVTFGHLFQRRGYKTCVAGKWQLAGYIEGEAYKGQGSLPEEAGFDEHCLWQVQARGSRYWDPIIRQNGRILENTQNRFGPDLECDYLIDFIRRKHTAEQPFFVYYPMSLPHDPFVPTPLSGAAQEDPKKRNGSDRRFFGDMVRYMDHLVGRIVAALDDLGLREQTLVIFTGDNGTNTQISSQLNGQLYRGGKGSPTTAGTHVPLIVNNPGAVPAGHACHDLVDFTDFIPTLFQAAGLGQPASLHLDGRSFWPQCCGRQGNPRPWIYCYYEPKWGNYTNAEYAQTRRYKLYRDDRFFDIEADPLEKGPLDANTLNKEIRQIYDQLSSALKNMKRQSFP